MPGARPADVDRFVRALDEACRATGVSDNSEHLAAFLAQVAHESQQLRRTSENLNYSAEGLLATFPKYFTPEQAQSYARQPERIANHVYANRLGNGDEASGDGWRHRGMGLIQVTGKANQRACLKAIGALDPEFLQTAEGATRSASWFWQTNSLGEWVDKGDFDGLSDVINRGRKTVAIGDSNGWTDRVTMHARARSALGLD
jgi:putative chitinase